VPPIRLVKRSAIDLEDGVHALGGDVADAILLEEERRVDLVEDDQVDRVAPVAVNSRSAEPPAPVTESRLASSTALLTVMAP
jgi:hypothetical protein